MQIQLIGASIAIGIPKTGFGLNATTFVYIRLRPGPGTLVQTLAVDDHFSVGGRSGTFVWSNVRTSWTNIDSVKYPWVCNAPKLTGNTIDLEVVGTMFGAGKADIKMSLIDKDGETKSLVSKMNIESEGFQLTGLKVRGILKLLPGAKSLRCDA
ncbi:MAG: hypothetical protein GY799_05935 [Desulfobulbaceae bacterium]|nr:hypothetical protein [Desulfobulbaceae bacterium]